MTLLVRRQKEHHPASEKLSDELHGVVICLERYADVLHVVQLMSLPAPSSLASLKSRVV